MEKPFVWAVLLYLPAGLNLTYASTFQMLRGAVVIFTGLLSVAFLNRRLRVYQWWGIFLVFLGLIVVGLADVIAPPSDQKSQNINNIITGKEWMYVLLYYCTICDLMKNYQMKKVGSVSIHGQIWSSCHSDQLTEWHISKSKSQNLIVWFLHSLSISLMTLYRYIENS